MTDALAWIEPELARLQSQGLRRSRRVVRPLPDAWCLVDGRRLRNFAANDYLNLAHDPRVVEAASRALDACGVGAGASALVSGRTVWHAALEDRLARFERQESTVLFPTGYAANVGTICALAGPDDVIYSDRLNHASLIDGCRLSRARVHIYQHDDLDGLERALAGSADAGRRLIVTDSVFSMDGDLAPLPDLCDLAERFDATLVVDEAHATGVFGACGRGVAELQQVEGRVTVRVGTLSKGVGALGGFVTGSQPLTDWLWNRSRTQFFSTALPPAVCAAATTAIDLIESEPWRRETVLRLSVAFHDMLSRAGIPAASEACSPIVPVVLHSPETALRVAARLEEHGFLVGAIRPPSVPEGTSRLRLTISAAHTTDEIARLAAAIATAAKELCANPCATDP